MSSSAAEITVKTEVRRSARLSNKSTKKGKKTKVKTETKSAPEWTPPAFNVKTDTTEPKSAPEWTPPTEEQIDGYMQPDKPWNRGYLDGQIKPRDPQMDETIREMLRSGQITINESPAYVDVKYNPKPLKHGVGVGHHPTLTEAAHEELRKRGDGPGERPMDPLLKKILTDKTIACGSKEDETYKELPMTLMVRMKMLNDYFLMMNDQLVDLAMDNAELRERLAVYE